MSDHDPHDPLCAYDGMYDAQRSCWLCKRLRAARAEERERIAREIEAHAEKVGAVDPPPQQDDYYAAMHDAARIARGSRAQA